MDQIALFEEACALAERQVEAAMATPQAQTGCADWNCTQLVNHLVVVLTGWSEITAGKPMSADPFNPPHVLGDDFLADYRAASAAAVAGFSAEGLLAKMLPSPTGGEMPGGALINFPTFDMYIHSWDLSQATGLAGEYPDHLTEVVNGFAQMAFAEERAPQVVGPALSAPAGASDFEQLLAFLGRQA